MPLEKGLTVQRIISELTRSPHGNLAEYAPLAKQAVGQDPDFFAHLIAWNEKNGQIRDAKAALPVLSLQTGYPYLENSFAHLAMLDPRTLMKALRFAKEPGIVTAKSKRQLLRVVERYLRTREAAPNFWTKTTVQHRASMKSLYAMFHIRPEAIYDAILFKGVRPPGSVWEAIHSLKGAPPEVAARLITEHRIPFLIATQALGGRMDKAIVLAIMERMTPSELVTNSKYLEKLGVREVPELRAAYEEGLKRVAESKKVALKTSVAAKSVTDPTLKKQLDAAQEKQLQNLAAEGNWLVLGDRSSSMQVSIEASRNIAGTLAKMVKGEVHLIFFNNSPQYLNVTGKSYEEVLAATRNVTATGGTSIGCGLQYILEKGVEVNGIAVVSDGGENGLPIFAQVYQRYCEKFGSTPPVYFYFVRGQDPDVFTHNMKVSGIEMQVFDLRGGVDYYSLPNLVATMRPSRYSLLDEIMSTPLVTLNEVLKVEKENEYATAD